MSTNGGDIGQKTAGDGYVISIATDQGTGGSICSVCGAMLDDSTWFDRTLKSLITALDKFRRGIPFEPSEAEIFCSECGARLRDSGAVYVAGSSSLFDF